MLELMIMRSAGIKLEDSQRERGRQVESATVFAVLWTGTCRVGLANLTSEIGDQSIPIKSHLVHLQLGGKGCSSGCR